MSSEYHLWRRTAVVLKTIAFYLFAGVFVIWKHLCLIAFKWEEINKLTMHFEELDALDPRNPTLARIEMPTPHKVSVLILVQQYTKVGRYKYCTRLFYVYNDIFVFIG